MYVTGSLLQSAMCTTAVKSFVFGLTYESLSVQRKFLRDLQKPGELLLKTILKITSLTS